MAITNAQQVQQMQLVKKRKDGKRPGYYGPDMGHVNDPGTDFGKDTYSGGGSDIDFGGAPGGSDRDFERTRNIINARQAIENKKAEEAAAKKEKVKDIAKTNITKQKDKTKNMVFNQDFLDTNYGLTGQQLTDLDIFDTNDDGKIGPLEKLDQLRTKVAKKTLTNSIAQKLGVMPKSYVPSVFMSDTFRTTPKGINTNTLTDMLAPDFDMGLYGISGKDLTRAKNQLDVAKQDKISQADFDSVYGNKPPIRDNDNDGPQDPCKGPNPPAYCFVGIRAAEEPVVEEESPQAIPYRLMNMGGDTEDAPLMAGAPELKLEGDVQPKQENMMMAEADPFLMEEYEKYVFDMEEMGLQPMTFEEFRREAMSGMAGGGIAELRQGYFLGGITKSIKKAVKGATRAVKKITKSKLGRAALLGAGIYGLGGGFGAGFKFSNIPGAGLFKSEGLKNFFLKDATKKLAFDNLSTKGLMAGVGALSALPLLGIGTGEEEEGEEDRGPGLDIAGIRRNPYLAMQRSGNPYRLMAEGGNAEPVAKDVMPLLDMNGKEKDYRETGGFVDMGRMEKADDVPARLSKNEFVFTADAVRNAGEGDIDKGAEVMYNMMKNLESGGEVSEDSQGLDGARAMFQTSQKLEGVM